MTQIIKIRMDETGEEALTPPIPDFKHEYAAKVTAVNAGTST
jgi:hypothetical protein